jgi:putative ATP-binding cassette transporter
MSSSVTARAATFTQVLRRVSGSRRPTSVRGEMARRAMLLTIVALNLAYVYVAVLGNQWYGRFYDALQNKDAVVFWREVGVFGWIAFFNIAVQVLKFYVTQLLQLRWRSWMTRNYLTRWMSDRTFYHLELARYAGKAGKDGQAPDNPDQRIQEDMQLFTDYTMTLSMGLLNAVVTLMSFVGILWALSGNFSFTMGGTTYQVVGAMVWLAVAYCVVGTVITHFIGRPLIGTNFTPAALRSRLPPPPGAGARIQRGHCAGQGREGGARPARPALRQRAAQLPAAHQAAEEPDHLHLVLRAGRGDLPVRGGGAAFSAAPSSWGS